MARFNSPGTPMNGCFILSVLLTTVMAAVSCSKSSSQTEAKYSPQAEVNRGYLTGSLEKDVPQAIYADDPDDCWNLIFYHLFTRTVKTRVTDDFRDAAPFDETNLTWTTKAFTTRVLERIESGDRAIEPLYYPQMQYHPPYIATARVLEEPNHSQFKRALTDALGEKTNRAPLARALMQSDAWAAYEIISWEVSYSPGSENPLFHERLVELQSLLAQFIEQLALTAEEIKRLPDNFSLAASVHNLPDLFGRNSEWLEVSWLRNRFHDTSAGNRRVAREFLKPLVRLTNKQAFLNTFWNEYHGRVAFNARPDYSDRVAAVALVIQNLLLDKSGKVVPSPITYAVQTRTFIRNVGGKVTNAKFAEFDLNRRLYLTNRSSGGMVAFAENSPAYTPGRGGFNFGFASTLEEVLSATEKKPAMLVSTRSRCSSCHGPEGRSIITFGFESPNPPAPPVRLLNASRYERAEYVASKKMEQEDFKKLIAGWK